MYIFFLFLYLQGQKLQIDELFQNSTENVCNCVKYKCGKSENNLIQRNSLSSAKGN